MRVEDAKLVAFRETAHSLKLYRRAELADEDGASLIEALYVDPLPDDSVLRTILKPNTTFIVGRRGTGKSTIFQRAQQELRGSKQTISAYVDIKTVYESSQIDPAMLDRLVKLDGTLPQPALEKLLLYRGFLNAVIYAIREELSAKIARSFWEKLKAKVAGSVDELFEGLDELLNDVYADNFVSILATRTESSKVKQEESSAKSSEGGVAATVGSVPGITASSKSGASASASTASEREFTEVLLRVFDMKEYIRRLRELLQQVGIRHLYVFVDDFSELPLEAMRLVVDALLAPLNNWSDELVKFKVAAYPGRIYYGAIDKTKIDEINLDLYSLYGKSNVADMEEKAIDFTRRLMERRLQHFGPASVDEFFDDEACRHLFYASMANPRNLGYLMFFMYESNLLYRGRLGVRAIAEAARRYYEEKVEAYFGMNRFLYESFEERSSIYSLKELLDRIVERARELRSNQSSEAMRLQAGRAPTSHFHVATDFEPLLASLELNFFLTKYYVQSDRDGKKVTVFALNYGLCSRSSIAFGRPMERREDRLYYVERVFDYTPILREYLNTNQEIVCGSCETRYEPEQLRALEIYGMRCPTCQSGVCRVTNLSRKYESMLRAVDDALLLPRVDLGILHTLGTETHPQSASEVAEDLDCSYQLVGKRAKILADKGLVDRSKHEQGRRQLEITDKARQTYFSDLAES